MQHDRRLPFHFPTRHANVLSSSQRSANDPVRLFYLLLLSVFVMPALAAPVAARAQAPAPRGGLQRAEVHGAVYDSIAGRPLVGALVQLVAADSGSTYGRTAVSDSLGAFRFADAPSGRFTLGFYHAVLDSLGLEPLLRTITVADGGSVRADLATPSAARLRMAICGAPTPQNSGAVVMGIVRDATARAPASGVTVIAEWLELSFGTGGMNRRMPRRLATTRETGWFAICHVPSPGSMTLMATRGADSTATIQIEVSSSGLLRRELYLGAARVVAAVPPPRDSALQDSTALQVRRVHVGEGRLTGSVRATTDGRPLAGAQISILDGPQTRTNARGEWTLTDAPPGTRLLEVRAVGYYPERRAVDIVDSVAPLRIALATFKSVLDTMKISATRTVDMNLLGFQERRRSSVGRFLTPRDIAVRQPFVTSEIFRSVPGLFLDRTMDAEEKVMMRGLFEDRCEPAIYINGQWMNGLTSGDLDGFIRPTEIAGIEVYMAGQVPTQFQPGLGGCGSLVFWTK